MQVPPFILDDDTTLPVLPAAPGILTRLAGSP